MKHKKRVQALKMNELKALKIKEIEEMNQNQM